MLELYPHLLIILFRVGPPAFCGPNMFFLLVIWVPGMFDLCVLRWGCRQGPNMVIVVVWYHHVVMIWRMNNITNSFGSILPDMV